MIDEKRLQSFMDGTANPTREEIEMIEEIAPGSAAVYDSIIWKILEGQTVPEQTLRAIVNKDPGTSEFNMVEHCVAAAAIAKLEGNEHVLKVERVRLMFVVSKSEPFKNTADEFMEQFDHWMNS